MSPSHSQILLANQPIYDRNKALFGCELLFRSDQNLTAEQVGDDQATSEVLVNLCTSIIEQSDQLQRPIFINLSESLLISEAFFPIEPERVILELLERIDVTPEAIAAVKRWRKEGFRFALDDFDFDPRWAPLVPLAEFIKVDVLGADPSEIANKRRATQTDPKTLWIAERVETREAFEAYREDGFDLFQGYFLARPKPVLGKSIRSDQSSALDIIRAVNDPELSMDQLSSVISRDPRLTMQLLRIVNSPACSLNREIETIKETVVYLGVAQVRKWAIILSLLAVNSGSSEICRLILIRAKAMESWCELTDHRNDAATAFMVGLLSGVDLLLEVEPAVFLQQVRLSGAINRAIIDHQGGLGKLLAAALALEHDVLTKPDRLVRHNGVLLSAYTNASLWAEMTLKAVGH